MVSNISNKIVQLLVKNRIIMRQEFELYQYGFEMTISTIIILFIVIIMGLIFKELITAIIFFVLFAIIRSSSGGYHADTYFKCSSIYTINIIIVLCCVKFAPLYYSLCDHIIFLTIYFFSIIKFSPLENKYKALNELEEKKHKILCILYGLILSVVSIALLLEFNQVKYAITISMVLLSVAMSIDIEKLIRMGGVVYEKSNS